jgi:hypothetical protein
MVKHATGAVRPRQWRRLAAIIGVAAMLVIPFGYTFAQFWAETGEHLEFTREERVGVEYLRPLTRLVSVLSDAQSAAVRGEQPNSGTLQGALTSVANADRKLGEQLGTRERWVALSQRLNQLGERKVSGREAYNSYSESIDLTLALVSKVGDTSKLILDPELDAYYLMDTTLLRLPSLIVDSGRMVDLARVGGGTAPTQVFAARDRVASTSTAIDTGLKKSFDVTESSTLGPALLGHVDRLRTVSTEIAPTTSLLELPVSLSDAGKVADARERLRDAAIQLDDATLTELDALLDEREGQFNQERTGVVVAVLLALLIGGAVLWSRLPDRAELEDDELAAEPRHRRTAQHPAVDADDEEFADGRDLMDARQLLSDGELVRVGRAVQPNRRERLRDDAE